jgi:hypothetical protein
LTGGDGARTYGACLNFFEGLDNEEELHKLQNVLENLRIEIGTRNSLMTSNDATDSELENDDEEDENVLGEGENEMLSAKQKRRRGSTTPGTIKLFKNTHNRYNTINRSTELSNSKTKQTTVHIEEFLFNIALAIFSIIQDLFDRIVSNFYNTVKSTNRKNNQ